ncbi:unnamed protein product, partial [Rhizoctonia solani]
MAIHGKRFGVPRAVFTDDRFTGNHPSINAEFNKALDLIRSLGGVVVDPADIPSAAHARTFLSEIEKPMLKVDLKVDLNRYLGSLRSVPTNVTTLKALIEYNYKHSELERTNPDGGQSLLVESQETNGHNPTYFTTLDKKFKLGREQGIDAALQAHCLDALILPSNGLTTSIAALAGYPVITVPLGFHPEEIDVTESSRSVFPMPGPHTIFPAPGVPFGISFLGTAYSEPSLIGFAYAYEQNTHARLKRRAYPAAIPTC